MGVRVKHAADAAALSVKSALEGVPVAGVRIVKNEKAMEFVLSGL
jgi:hypothetical protein